jgi:hypothetical protein
MGVLLLLLPVDRSILAVDTLVLEALSIRTDSSLIVEVRRHYLFGTSTSSGRFRKSTARSVQQGPVATPCRRSFFKMLTVSQHKEVCLLVLKKL